MKKSSHRKLWMLYLLAIFQLAAGPFVIVSIALFCHLTVPEIPKYGVVPAMAKAWNNMKFQGTLCAAAGLTDTEKSQSPHKNPYDPLLKVKMPPAVWQEARFKSVNHSQLLPQLEIERVWTPAWPQAPPRRRHEWDNLCGAGIRPPRLSVASPDAPD